MFKIIFYPINYYWYFRWFIEFWK